MQALWGGGAENVKQTKNTWHTAQKKIKFRLFLYPLSEIAAGNIPVWAKIKLLRCVFGKRGTKIVRTFFGRTLLCRVPGKNYAGEGIGAVPCAT